MSADRDIISQVLQAAQSAGVELWAENGKLRFRAPKGALTPELRSHLGQHKAALIEHLSSQARITIPRADRDAKLPLSRSQLRLWLIDKIMPGQAVYNEVLATKISGPLQEDILLAAVQLLSDRHEVLRTTFEEYEGEVRQNIHAQLPPLIEKHDLRDWPSRLRQAQLTRLLDRVSQFTFELDRGPLHHVHVIRMQDEEVVVVHVLHHIICDAWSTQVYIRELQSAYIALIEGRAVQLEELPIQFADYAVWQERRFAAGEFDAQLQFWREELAGLPALMPLPLDSPRGSTQHASRGDSVTFKLGGTTRSRVEELARSQQATPFTVMLSLWAAYLSRWSGAEDFALGTPVANRALPELESQIGFYVNTLPLRIRVHGRPDLHELIGRVRTMARRSLQNQDLPFDQLVAEMAADRNAAHSPIFQVMFIFEEEPPVNREFADLEMQGLEYKIPITKFDISLVLLQFDGAYLCHLEYDLELFDRDHVEQVAADFRRFVLAALEAPATALADLEIGDRERERALLSVLEGNRTQMLPDETIVSRFSRQVEIAPNAVALHIENKRLSYEELNAQSNQIAHALRAVGVGVNDVVALVSVGGAAAVICALGILKSGAAYMPLDPSYPAGRRAVMLQRADVKVALATMKLPQEFGEDQVSGALTVLHSANILGAAEFARSAANVPVFPASRANVIFTSGSTGEPKGVAITHANVLRLVNDSRIADLRPDDVFLQFAALAFDLSTFEMWTPLLHGASLACLENDDHGLSNLARLIRQHGVSILWLTAGLYHAAIDEGLEELLQLRRLIAGGEALAPDKTAALRSRFSGDLLDGYGPTENCVFTSMFNIPPDFDGKRSVPIGTPLDNSPLYVLDEQLERVRPGVVGTLYAGGPGVAQAYVGRPALTAEKFIPNPFSTEPGARMYNTGDRVRLLRSGLLEFHGRADRQVKVRGFRIEPADIELQLRKHPAVEQIHVAAVSGRRQLAAWYVPLPTATQSNTELEQSLRAFAESSLPGYMQPAAWIRLEQMPLTANGKLDRARLPAAFGTSSADQSRATTTLEQILWRTWADLLEREDFGVETSFFTLGGHSLKAMQMTTRLERSGVKGFSVRILFDFPTIRALAERLAGDQDPELEQRHGDEIAAQTTPPRAVATTSTTNDLATRHAVTSFAQQRLWFLNQLQASAAYNVPLRLSASAKLDHELLGAALQALMQRHAALRTRFDLPEGFAEVEVEGAQHQESGGTPQQILEPPAKIALPFKVVDLSRDAEAAAKLEELALEHSRQIFNMQRAPLWNCSLVFLPQECSEILLTVHHSIVDAASAQILLEEFAELYTAQVLRRGARLPAQSVTYAQFAEGQKRAAAAGRFERDLDFWFDHLQGAVGLLDLPYDRLRPANPSWSAGYVHRRIDGRLYARLTQFAEREGLTPFMLMLTAYLILLRKHGQSDSLVVGTPFSQQASDAYEHVVGYFVNTLPLHFKLRPQDSLRQVLRQVRATMLAAFEKGGVPLDLIVDRMNPERSRSHAPLFQTLFAVQPHVAERLAFGKQLVQVRPGTARAAKFDLTLDIRPDGENWSAEFEYASELFDAATVDRLADRYINILHSLAEIGATAPTDTNHIALTEVRLEDPPAETSDSLQTFDSDEALFQKFIQQAAAAPSTTALTFNDQSSSYAELHADAWLIAAALHAELQELADKTPDEEQKNTFGEARVGILFERGLELPATLIATHMAAAAYVPLDPAYPADRLQFMIEDANLSCIIYGPDVEPPQDVKAIPMFAYAALVESGNMLMQQGESDNSATFKACTPEPEQLAYIIYTSGSTGQPKGVGVTHANMARLFAATDELYNFDAQDVWTLFHSYAFDFSVWEMWGALIHGGRLVIVPQEVAKDSAQFCRLLERENVTVLNQTPTAFQHLLKATVELEKSQRPKDLRLLIFGGEKLNTAVLGSWFELFADGTPQVFNMFGITETTVHVTARRIRPRDVALPRSPIGKPLADLQLHILDEAGNPAPVGVPGELYVSGDGLARAYLSRPALTAARFLPAAGGRRMYRSGDIARRRPDGDIDYLGRNDSQVQLRGYRIELGEIEHAISSHAAVESACVRLRGPLDRQRLLAWFVPSDATQPNPEAELKNLLAERLPAYMLPQAWIQIERLPLTPTGKVDHSALPAPKIRDGRNEFNSTEAGVIARMMAELLNIEAVGPDDNFFALGGHSLLVTRLSARMRAELGAAPSLKDLFDRPTPNTLAELLLSSANNNSNDGSNQLLPDPTVKSDAAQSADVPGTPAAYGQERLWILQKLTPQACRAYIVSLWLDVKGELQDQLFWQAWMVILQRHAMLRASFSEFDGMPRLVFSDAAELSAINPQKVHDLRSLDAAAADKKLQEITAAENEQAFDLSRPPLFRLQIVHVRPQQSRILFTFDHSIIDAWSREIILRELMQVYAKLCRGQAFDLPPLKRGFADLAGMQRRVFERGDLNNSVAYWLDSLADMPALLELPGDFKRPAQASFKGGLVPIKLDVNSSDALRQLARQEKKSLFVVLLSAFKLLLSRYTLREDIVVGTPVANRNHPDSHTVVGYFLNTLVLRSRLNTRGSFAELLQTVHNTVGEAFEHQEVPFEHLVKQLDAGRERSHAPLVQIMFMLQHEDELYVPDGLELDLRHADRTSAKFDLTLGIYDDGEGSCLHGGLEYNSDLFRSSSIEILAERLVRVFSLFVTELKNTINSVPVLAPSRTYAPEALAGEILAGRRFPAHEFLFKQFERQALANPSATALRFEGESRSYGQLLSDARTIAAGLCNILDGKVADGEDRTQQIGPDKLIGLMLYRGPDLPAAIIAVHMCGAAYVPLDPNYPADRLTYMAADAGLLAVLTDIEEPKDLGVKTLQLSQVKLRGANQVPPATLTPAPQNLAYIIYTSGSTGTPKGVGVSHSNAIRLFDATRELFNFCAQDVWTLFHSYAFDFSVWEMWGALIHGGSLVIVPRHTARDPQAFLELLHSEQVTVLNQTPSAFLQLQHIALPENVEPDDACGTELLNKLRLVIFGGEALQTAALQTWFDTYGEEQPQLFNMFGITETTVHVTARRITARDCREGGSPIGRPLADLGLEILDDAGFPVPDGVPGELYVTGGGISRGYLGRPALTAENFLPAPGGQRMYRTGDIALRHLHAAHRDSAEDQSNPVAGDIEYLRRRDFQVQLRGYRIELGEIEHVLAQHNNVAECHVMLREDDARPRIVAYVVARGLFNAQILREYLRRRLPAYMLPAAIVPLPTMPLTPTGKLHRRALPPPTASQEFSGRQAAPAVEIIAGLMADLLETETLAPGDDFFVLGGHSLLVTRLAARIHAAFGTAPSAAEIFEFPSPAGIAALLQKDAGKTLPPLDPRSTVAALQTQLAPLAFGQERIWVLLRIAPLTALAYAVPYRLDIEGALDPALMLQAWNVLVKQHPILRTDYPQHDQARIHAAEQILNGNSNGRTNGSGKGGEKALRPGQSLLDLSVLPAQEAAAELEKLAQAQAAQPFDVKQGPLFRITLVRLAEERHCLLLTLHHISVDAWSCEILFNALMQHYSNLRAGGSFVEYCNALARPKVEFADYAAWQRSLQDQGYWADSLQYWKRQLEGLPPLLELPSDRPRPAQQSYRGAQVASIIDTQLSDALRAAARREGVTPFMFLLAVFKLLLARYAMREDIAVGSPIANRQHPDTHGLAGFFLNMLVLRSRVQSRVPFRELLHAVRRTVLDAHRHQEVPFEQLVQEIVSRRAMSHAPLVQVVFVLQQSMQVQAPEGLKIEVSNTYLPTSKFDLTLGLEDAGPGTSLSGGIEFNSEIFDAAGMQELEARFQTLLRALVENVNIRCGDVDLLSPQERKRSLQLSSLAAAPSSNQAKSPAKSPSKSFMQRCFAAAAANPAALALDTGAQQWTYAQLFNKVAQVSAALQGPRPGLHIGPEVRVAVALPRSAELLIAQLAIFRAGGVYVPLDPHYPPARRNRMLQLSAAQIVIAPPGRAADFSAEHPNVQIVSFADLSSAPASVKASVKASADSAADQLSSELSELALADSQSIFAEQAAYIIFTSGSTGEPKGVTITYAGFDNTIAGINAHANFTAGDRHFAFASSNFDVSLFECIAPLTVGASVCLYPTANLAPGAPLAESLRQSRASHAFLTPSAAAALPSDQKFEDLRCLMLGAEAVSADLVRRFEQQRIINLYGPTEVSICSTMYLCKPAEERPPIGFGLPGIETYVLDDNMQPVAPGMIGELWLAGVGLARAYAGSAAESARKFLPHPFVQHAVAEQGLGGQNSGPGPGARIYGSGDLVRRRRDGAIEFLGRRDHQIKLRGFRVELGEIEHSLRSLPEVGDACAILCKDPAAGVMPAASLHNPQQAQILAAYVTPAHVKSGTAGANASNDLQAHRLRRRLSGSLPRYMLPDAIIVLDTLPLTSNGKLDRDTLPAPFEQSRQQSDGKTQMPGEWTELEQALAEIWHEILPDGAPQDRDANFFEQGGNSLRAVTLLERLRAEFNEKLQINELFDNSTIRSQAALLQEYNNDLPADAASQNGHAANGRNAAGTNGSTPNSKDAEDDSGRLRRVDF